MKYRMVSLVAVLAASLAIVGCTQTAPPPTPTKAAAVPTKAPEPTKAPAAPTKAPESTKAAAPAKKVDFPQKGRTVTLIVPYTAGGSTDMGARVLAPFLEKELGIPALVVNKPGAGAQVGLTELVQSRPDGYTLGYTNLPTVMTLYLEKSRKAIFSRNSFVPLSGTLVDPMLAGVKSDSKYKSLKDLMDAAKENPEQVKVSTGGILGSIHLAALVAQKAAGVKFGLVIFDGGGPALTALLGGHVDAAFNTGAEQASHFKSGTVRTLGIMDNQGSKYYPGVKTFEEQGYKAYMSSTHGISAPPGTPKEVIDILESAIKRATDGAEYKKRMEDAGLEPRYVSGSAFAAAWDAMEADIKALVEELTKDTK